MNIRQYNSSDFTQLIALYKDKRAYGGNYDESRDTKERLLATAQKGNLYVAEESGRIVGSFMVLENPHTFRLLRFIIDPNSTDNITIGRELTKAAESIARQRGHQNIIVYTDAQDDSLNKRYIDLDFHKAGQYRCYWKEIE